MGVDDALIREVVRRVLTVARPERVILFGSAASGEMTRDSDIDLLVIERAPASRREEVVRILDSLRGLGFPFDVFVMSADKFDESKSIFGGLAYPAHKYGRVIYEAA